MRREAFRRGLSGGFLHGGHLVQRPIGKWKEAGAWPLSSGSSRVTSVARMEVPCFPVVRAFFVGCFAQFIDIRKRQEHRC